MWNRSHCRYEFFNNNHAPLDHISGCIKIDKKLKKIVNGDSPSENKLKKFTDSYGTAVEKWKSKILDETRRIILGSLGVKKKKIDLWDHPMSSFVRKL